MGPTVEMVFPPHVQVEGIEVILSVSQSLTIQSHDVCGSAFRMISKVLLNVVHDLDP